MRPMAHWLREQIERIRKMLLAFSRDLRVVLLRRASRLQTLRYYAQKPRPRSRTRVHAGVRSSGQPTGHLADQLELEDLSFRFLSPDVYRSIAKGLDEKRVEREIHIERVRQQLAHALSDGGLSAQVQGPPQTPLQHLEKDEGQAVDPGQGV